MTMNNITNTATTTTTQMITTTTELQGLLTMLIMSIVVAISTIKLKQRSTTLRRNKMTKNHPPLPPSPSQWPVIGNIPEITFRTEPTFRWIHKVMEEKNTDIACIRLANTYIIPVVCPKLAREMLKQQDANFADRPVSMSTQALSGGYKTTALTQYGEQWRKMRKIMVSEIISPTRHRWLHDKRAEEADNLVFYVHNQYMKGKAVDLRIVTQHYCGNVIRKMMFNKRYFKKSIDDGGPGLDEIKHVQAVFTALEYTYSFCISDYLPFLRGFDLDGQEKIINEANKTIRDYQNPIVDERAREWRAGERKEMVDLLDVFITLKDNDGNPLLTLDEIKSQLVELAIAAIDNPSNAIEWTMAELLNQPDLFRKATEEIDRVVGKERLVEECDIQDLNYVKACAKESYRLHPVAPFNVPHVSLKDTVVGGYFIPRGSHVLLGRYGLGRNPKVWKDPLIYDPDRHMGTDGNQQVMLTEHDLRFISFSTGRRGCVASVLGTCMTTMLLARLLQCFDWTVTLRDGKDNSMTTDLKEAEDNLLLAKPLTAFAVPRLPSHLYPVSI